MKRSSTLWSNDLEEMRGPTSKGSWTYISEKGDPLTHVKSFYAHPPNVLKWLMMIVLWSDYSQRALLIKLWNGTSLSPGIQFNLLPSLSKSIKNASQLSQRGKCWVNRPGNTILVRAFNHTLRGWSPLPQETIWPVNSSKSFFLTQRGYYL